MAQKRILSRCSARWRDPSVRFYVLSLCSWSRPHVSTSPASPKTRITWGYVISSMSFIPRYTKSMQVRVWHLKRFVLQWRHTSDILITSSTFIKTKAYVLSFFPSSSARWEILHWEPLIHFNPHCSQGTFTLTICKCNFWIALCFQRSALLVESKVSAVNV